MALGLTQMTVWGALYYAFSVVLKPMQTELGWDSGTLTGAFSLGLFLSGVAAIPAGKWLDRHGARGLMTAGSCVASLLLLAWALVETIPAFYAVWFGIGLVMAMVLYEPAFAVIANWFVLKRSRALTLLTLGGGMASVVYVPLTQWLTSEYGWRAALIVLALIVALVTIPLHGAFLRRRPSDMGLLPDGDWSGNVTAPSSVSAGFVLRESTFWWLSLAFMLSLFVVVALTVHLIPYLTGLGFSSNFSAGMISVIGGSQIPGRLIFAPISERMDKGRLTALIFGMQGFALFFLLVFPTPIGAMVAAVMFGASSGVLSPARAVLVAELYGHQHYGSISGLMNLTMTFAKALAPVSVGFMFSLTRSYTPVMLLLIILCVIASIMMLQVKPLQGR